MTLVAGYKAVGARRIGALQEFVVAGILRNMKWALRSYDFGAVLDELKHLQTETVTDLQFPTITSLGEIIYEYFDCCAPL